MTARRKSTDSEYDEHGNPLYKSEAEIQRNIDRSIPAITAGIKSIYSLIKKRRTWLPPKSVIPEIHEFYQQLNIPLFNGSPSLLVHGLDATPTPTASPLSNPLFEAKGPQLR